MCFFCRVNTLTNYSLHACVSAFLTNLYLLWEKIYERDSLSLPCISNKEKGKNEQCWNLISFVIMCVGFIIINITIWKSSLSIDTNFSPLSCTLYNVYACFPKKEIYIVFFMLNVVCVFIWIPFSFPLTQTRYNAIVIWTNNSR